jgi:hypothetical protein
LAVSETELSGNSGINTPWECCTLTRSRFPRVRSADATGVEFVGLVVVEMLTRSLALPGDACCTRVRISSSVFRSTAP